jgi:predicted NACHT family NTPase
MLPWDSFLEKAADNHKLFAGDDRQIFLKRFSEEHLNNLDAKVAAQLDISEVTLQRRLGNVYTAFIASCPSLESNKKGKLKILLDWLKSEYANYEKTSKESEIKWRDICLAMLESEKQQRLTTNQFMGDDEHFDIEEIHVPLALVERKKPNLIGGETQAEQGSRLYEPEYEEKQRFEHEQFLLDILKDGKGKHKGKRIAIIGEPGAGKTTLLRKIAFWVQENTEILPISISLADLPETNSQQQFLEQYLLDKWLPAALPYFSPEMVEVTEALKTELKKLCNQGRVWLLLDGVDEMPVQGEERLGAISNQLKGWVGQARVVLTCRLNVWEANRNVLADNFEIYRTLEFSYGDSTTPDRVEEFIAKWFNKQPNLGQQLRQELDKPGKERIKDLVKNPLRLALLCSTWNCGAIVGVCQIQRRNFIRDLSRSFMIGKARNFPQIILSGRN